MQALADACAGAFASHFNETLQTAVAVLVEVSAVPIQQRRVVLLTWLARLLMSVWLIAGIHCVGKRWRAVLRPRERGAIVILYDDDCTFCRGCIAYVLARCDGIVSVAPLESAVGKSLMAQFRIPQPASSFVLVEDDSAYTQSDASLRMFSLLRPRHWLLVMLVEPVPLMLRDAVYDLVWRHRRRLFGTVFILSGVRKGTPAAWSEALCERDGERSGAPSVGG